ncbi:MAG TPA: hypothetical protein ACFCUD_14680 [Cyclobacteriaceae bacterium]
MSYKYHAFGLNILSELFIPEFIQANLTNEDITISFGSVPELLKNARSKGIRYWASPNQLLLKVDNIAKYFVENGNRITIEPLGGDDKDIRLFLLGSAFGALLLQRKQLVLHASSVLIDEKAVLFAGKSGAGKSTTAAAFRNKGFKVINDDISLISFDQQGVPRVISGYPQMKLWIDSLKALEMEPNDFEKIREALEKRCIKINPEDFYSKNESLIDRIFILNNHNKPEISINDITGPAKFQALKNHTFRFQFLKGLDIIKPHFELSMKLASVVPMYRILKPGNEISFLPKMIGELLNHLNIELIDG